MILQTLTPQKSLNNSWTITPMESPTGVITGIQLTTSSLSPVYVSGLSSTSGVLSITLVQDGVLVGQLSTESRGFNEVICQGTLIAGVVEIGYIPEDDINYSADIEINPCRILYTTSTATVGDSISGTVDGAPFEINPSSDLEIVLDPELTGDVSDSGILTIGLTATGYNNYMNTAYTQSNPTIIRSINGVVPVDNTIKVTIGYSEWGVFQATGSRNRIVLTPSTEIEGCSDYDVIDTYLHPDTFTGDLRRTPLSVMYYKSQVEDNVVVESVYSRDSQILEDLQYLPVDKASRPSSCNYYQDEQNTISWGLYQNEMDDDFFKQISVQGAI